MCIEVVESTFPRNMTNHLPRYLVLKNTIGRGKCVTTHTNHVDIVRFGPKGALTTLKCVYRVTRSPYLFSTRNFPPYLMGDVTNTPPCRHNVLVMSHRIAEPNRQTPLMGLNKPPHWGRGSTLIPFYNYPYPTM